MKWLESGGARVVPIQYDLPPAELKTLLGSLNGALFTGGAAAFFTPGGELTQYAGAAQVIYQESVNAHAAGEVWPLWGTCLGHELISVLGSGLSRDVLTTGFDSENISLPLVWTPAANSSSMWGGVPDIRAMYASPHAIAMNAHQAGITPAAFAANPALVASFVVTSTAFDRKGVEFTATMEGKDGLPIYSSQSHFEKPAYEMYPFENIVHTAASLIANNYGAIFFVEQARLNARGFASPDAEAAALIYNFSPVNTAVRDHSMFALCYFFSAAGGAVARLRGAYQAA